MNTFKRIIGYGGYLFLYLIVIVSLNLFLFTLPLAGVFGFEFSVINSLIISLLSGIYLIQRSKKEIRSNQHIIISGLLFALTPFILITVKSIVGESCSYIEGMQFYLILTLPSVIIGWGMGAVVSSFIPKFRIIVYIILYNIILFSFVLDIYFNPQIYFYNPLIGFFPGTVYDEALSVESRLLFYRVLNFLFFGSLFVSFWLIKYRSRVIKLSVLAVHTAILSLFIYFSPELGYSTTSSKMQEILNRKISTEHFDIYYSPQSHEKIVKAAVTLHEYYYKELKNYFKVEPGKKITTYLFHSSEQKGKLFGAENADVAKPWLYQIYIVYNNYNTTLKHELAHIFAGEFSTGLFKVADKFSPALIEGAAVAADPVYAEYYVEHLAAAAYKNGYKVNLNDIFGHFNFFRNPSGLSYIYAGAFTSFIIREYGIEKYKHLYADLDFNKYYSKSLDHLEKEFIIYLESINNNLNIHNANYFFGRKSIFLKTCPRYIGELLNRGWEKYNSKDFYSSLRIFKEAISISNDYTSYIGYINSLAELNKIDEAIAFLESRISSFDNTAYYYNLSFRLGDLYLENNNILKADSIYNDINFKAPNRTLTYLSLFRKDLIKMGSSPHVYIKGTDVTKFEIIKEMNKNFSYASIPVLINLVQSLGEDYSLFRHHLEDYLTSTDIISAYALYKLSLFMFENLDFENARRMAALSLRYRGDPTFLPVQQENYRMLNWIYFHHKKIISQLR